MKKVRKFVKILLLFLLLLLFLRYLYIQHYGFDYKLPFPSHSTLSPSTIMCPFSPSLLLSFPFLSVLSLLPPPISDSLPSSFLFGETFSGSSPKQKVSPNLLIRFTIFFSSSSLSSPSLPSFPWSSFLPSPLHPLLRILLILPICSFFSPSSPPSFHFTSFRSRMLFLLIILLLCYN